MHPAKSVIAFTTTSGAGYGLLVWLAMSAFFTPLPNDFWFGFFSFGLAFGLVCFGLLSSTFHLGHPERAWRAFSQWRSSWLSREGVMAVFTFIPTGIFAYFWVIEGVHGGTYALIGLVGAVASLITVYCTSMIYASLKAIPAWHNKLTPFVYLIFSLTTGGVLGILMLRLFEMDTPSVFIKTISVMLGLSVLLKVYYWRTIDNAAPVSTAESATGLGAMGKVSLLEAPHHGDNYLLKEMGFKVARKHAKKLRSIANFSLILCLYMVGLGGDSLANIIGATATLLVGVVCERWLFFAEAKHVVTLYYGETAI